MCAATPDLDHIYRNEAERYQELIAREDHEGNLLPAIRRVMPLEGIDVLETGAGTGRIALMLAPFARTVRAFDLNEPMLDVARSRAEAMGHGNVEFAVGGHRDLRGEVGSVDLVVAAWSLCYVYVDGVETWRDELSGILAGLRRLLRPGGRILVIETLGTGTAEPVRLPVLADYLDELDALGFRSTSIRTDYRFDTVEQARELSTFFFGAEVADRLEGCVLPEWTGLWWTSDQE